ncbi:gp93 [Corynebacterium phage P1201]|uniref:Gp93 n=1 Tax=Corynebacterium phage P1201 TaxID=384848 RepID=A7IYG0_9CAUD|nr:gp93 [Corynebacterium phage P1201]ABF57543.1 gp93 [Corynebacterium phage P1201]
MFNLSTAINEVVNDVVRDSFATSAHYADEYEMIILEAVTEFFDQNSSAIDEDYADRLVDYADNVEELKAEIFEEYAQVLISDYLDSDVLTNALRENCDLSIVYTEDVFRFYMENMSECDEALSELGGADQYGSISEALSVAVAFVRERQAAEELTETLETIHDSLDCSLIEL